MFETILVPIDLTDIERGKACINVAKRIGGPDCKIRLLSVIEEVPSYIAVELPRGLFEKSIKTAEQTLSDIAAAAGGNCDSQIRTGQPRRVILDAANDMEVDLIVIGSHRPGLQDYLIGSTASRVVRHACRSVLIVRQAPGN